MKTVAILLYDNVEVLDACGPFQVFASALDTQERALFRVVTVAEAERPIVCSGGLTILPSISFANYCEPQVLVVPGGAGRKIQTKNEQLIQYIRAKSAKAEVTLSVCSGSFLLASAGLLDGLAAATHHSTAAELRAFAPRCEVRSSRIVDNGRIVCSAGVSAGIDASLHVLARLHGAEQASRTARYMEYDSAGWQSPGA
ncbi:MAG: DJ-1/PfpI family protein [Candidatus Sumerlaeia bacterium]|nr:DJ-1/PfpI family protein [Candidatus Sumerlaeia bacterium]